MHLHLTEKEHGGLACGKTKLSKDLRGSLLELRLDLCVHGCSQVAIGVALLRLNSQRDTNGAIVPRATEWKEGSAGRAGNAVARRPLIKVAN